MNMPVFKAAAIVALCCLVVLPAAAEVYKWTDAQGRVHYGDRAPDQDVKPMDINPHGNSTSGVADDARRQENTRRLLRAFDEENRIKQEQQRKQQARESQRAKRCAEARDRRSRYRDARALYDFDKQGRRYFLSEEQRRQAEARAVRDVRQWCTD
jgi:hypothetical protein